MSMPFCTKKVLCSFQIRLSDDINRRRGSEHQDLAFFLQTIFFCSVGVQFQTVLMVMNREHKKSPCFIQFRIRRAKKFLGEKVKRLVYYVVVDKKEWICWRQETNEKKSYSHYILVHSILHSLAFWLNYYETASGDIIRDEIVLVGRTEPKLFLSFKIKFRSWRNSKSLV